MGKEKTLSVSAPLLPVLEKENYLKIFRESRLTQITSIKGVRGVAWPEALSF